MVAHRDSGSLTFLLEWHAKILTDLLTSSNNNSNIWQHARSTCTCAVVSERLKPVIAPQPGTVTHYSQHILLRLPRPDVKQESQKVIWWPPIVEKHPALLQAFTAIAASAGKVEGQVKVSAYETVDLVKPSTLKRDKAKVDLMIFPAGVLYTNLPQDRIQEAVAFHIGDVESDVNSRLLSPNFGNKVIQKNVANSLSIFVCTHMTRDTRCGVLGREVAAKLQAAIEEQDLQRVSVYQISHVGGHKYAGNVLVYGGISPCDGDWFGGINGRNALRFFEAILAAKVSADGGPEEEELRKWWRGRMGLSRDEQLELFQSVGVPFAVPGELEAAAQDPNSDSDSESSTITAKI